MSFKLTSGLHDSQAQRAKLSTQIWHGLQKSISFWYRDFVAMCKKLLNNNYLFEMKFLQHLLQLTTFSQATRKAVVWATCCAELHYLVPAFSDCM